MKNLKGIQSCTTYSICKTNIGWCGIVRNKKGLRRILIAYLKRQQLINHIKEVFEKNLVKEPSTGEFIENLIRYCLGQNVFFGRFKMDWSSVTPFQSKVFKATMKRPYGTVTTYRNLSQMIGYNNASRAVGNALSKNPFPLVVPCHRIIRSDGKIGGFSAVGGKSLKEKLLRMEWENS